MSTVYTHTESIFNPTTHVDREKFEARLSTMGKRLERYCKACIWDGAQSQEDIEDATQEGFIALWESYQKDPSLMDTREEVWFAIAKRAARRCLARLNRQRGSRNNQDRVINESALPATDETGLELAERRHYHSAHNTYRAEAEQSDKRIDLVWMLKHVLAELPLACRDNLKTAIPLIAAGHTLDEISKLLDINANQLSANWEALRRHCSNHTGIPLTTTKRQRQQLSPEQIQFIKDQIRAGVPKSQIAITLEVTRTTILNHTPHAMRTGNTKKYVTFEMRAQFRTLHDKGWSAAKIADYLGFSRSTVSSHLSNTSQVKDQNKELNQEEIAEILRLRAMKLGFKKIAKIIGRSPSTVRRAIPDDMRIAISQQDHALREKIRQAHRDGIKAHAEIARMLKCTRLTVSRTLGKSRANSAQAHTAQ
ncbi:MAG: helix-turn-helix domain-containing protein [Anaerolineae bacterium]|nr:helix-turn-helix domain-containing protein [Anaerolineae bacterium]